MEAKAIIDELAKMGVEAEMHEVIKNGIKKTGIALKKHDGISPVVYLEEFSGTPEEIAAEMADLFKQYADGSLGFDVNLLKSPEWILEKIHIGMQRSSEEADLVKAESGFPGIEKYLYLKMNGNMTAKVKFEILEAVGVTVQEAWESAERNTFADGETVITDLAKILGIPCEVDAPKLYIVTNKDGNRGSSAVLDTEAIRKYFGSDKSFTVFPSSIHEYILVPKEDCEEREGLDEMVQQINAAEVAPEEQLGDCAFDIAV